MDIWGMMSFHKGSAYLAMSTSAAVRDVTTLGVEGEMAIVPRMRSTIKPQRDLRLEQDTKSDTLKLIGYFFFLHQNLRLSIFTGRGQK